LDALVSWESNAEEGPVHRRGAECAVVGCNPQ
jgi:hypothetical protein